VVALALKWNLHVSGMSVLLETMACGRPLVATETPGIRDYVVDGETGLLVPPGDPDAFADAVGSLLDDPETAGRLAANARRRAVTELTTEHQAQRLAEMLRGAQA
jgi:glycosyltransferase involved in cell wall biosynthesis